MKKIKLLLLKIAEATFVGIVHFEVFISKSVNIPMLDKLAELAYRVYWSIDDVLARTLGYKNSSDFMQAWLERIAIYRDDQAERDTYDDKEDDNEV